MVRQFWKNKNSNFIINDQYHTLLVALLSLLVTTQKRKCDVLATVVPTLLYGFLLFLGYLLTYLT